MEMSDEIENSIQMKLSRKYQAENRMYSVLFEITHRCICRCIHCFLLKKNHDELNLDEIESLFMQLKREGVFEIAVSGGEPFIREDFPKILHLLSRESFLTNLLTTGILIKKPEVKLLAANNLKYIEISLLGAGSLTHDSIMQYPGAFKKMINAVKLLKEADFIIALKSIIIKQNWQELMEMAKLAKSLGVQYSANLLITPREDMDLGIQKLSLSPDEIQQLDISLIDNALLPNEKPSQNVRFTCRAGCTTAGISSNGDIYPCILLREKIGSIREKSIEQIWHSHPHPLLGQLRTISDKEISQCYSCRMQNHCMRCPGVSYMETGNLISPSPIACYYAQHIKERLKNNRTI